MEALDVFMMAFAVAGGVLLAGWTAGLAVLCLLAVLANLLAGAGYLVAWLMRRAALALRRRRLLR